MIGKIDGCINFSRYFHPIFEKGGGHLRSGICPKCESDKVYSGASLPLKKGPFGSNSIPVSLTSIAALDNYVCVACGYVESYVSETEKLTEIAKKWAGMNEPNASNAETSK